jgi:ferrochelatase
MTAQPPYDAVLVVSFGGPEGRGDVLPFLENVLRGRNVPRERMLEVAEHYYHFGGVSPLNEQNRALIAALVNELNEHGPRLPVYWGNRNWHPLLTDTVRQMAADGVWRALAFVTSAFSSYSGCRQYLENIAAARAAVGKKAPQIDKLRAFYNHPGFIEPVIERVQEALAEIPVGWRREHARLIFTAHSIPKAMAQACRYEAQLHDARLLVAKGLDYSVLSYVYQSRSGPPAQEWLGPDVCDWLRQLKAWRSVDDIVLVPIGFISDHMEVVYDLDIEARAVCDELGLNMVRAKTVGTHPKFISMIRELIAERTDGAPRRWLGDQGACEDECPADCCPKRKPDEGNKP